MAILFLEPSFFAQLCNATGKCCNSSRGLSQLFSDNGIESCVYFFYILPKSISKIKKNGFYFVEKALFVLEIFDFLDFFPFFQQFRDSKDQGKLE